MGMKTVVIGAGQAAIAFAAKLRELDGDAEITLIGDEPSLPYQRPPLSKKYMTGEMSADRLLLRPAEWYETNRVNCLTRTAATRIDLETSEIICSDKCVPFDKLLIATGSRPRTLPEGIGGDLPGVYTLRHLADADQIATEITEGRKAVIIGGGYIGLEAAAVFATKGLAVEVIEMADRILKRVASPDTAAYVKAKHEANGVTIREQTAIKILVEFDGRFAGVELEDTTLVNADFCVVGIGVLPNVELAAGAGIACENGILVDNTTRTSHADIHAAGDVANFEFRDARCRLESVQNAIDQAETAARAIAEEEVDYRPVPWFWSDQYDLKLQIAGLNSGYDQTVVRPGTRDGTQSVWYFREGKFLAVDALNDPRAYMFGKKILELGRDIAPGQAADASFDLKALVS
jgi:3-phenylpropionate/trans-cinnamate dioxygenase ferredoxin reductase subunit